MHLTEDILHFVWRHALFETNDLKTTDGQSLKLINRGIYNHHSGPDFSEGKIQMDQTTWVGQIEMHVNASDWYLHQHDKDKAYDNVILHVVYFDDRDVYIKGQKIPTLNLNGRIPPSLFVKYKLLLQKKNEIVCSYALTDISRPIIVSQLERSCIDRLEKKSDKILSVLKKYNNDWEETVFHLLCLQMIGKVNEQPMAWILNEIQLKKLRLSNGNSVRNEAILFGLAGMLDDPKDDYSVRLSKEYEFEKQKYGFVGIEKHLWKYGRIRPAQFPSLRLAQISAIVHKNEFLFDRLLKSDIEFISNDFLKVEVNPYWETHHQLAKPIKRRSVKIGKMQMDLLMINLIAPLLFAFGKYQSEEKWKEKALDLLMQIKPENNHIIKKWENWGCKAESAFDSQGMIELYNNSCIPKKCLTCNIGFKLLRA